MDIATTDQRRQWLMWRSAVIAEAMIRCFGPQAMLELERARTLAGFISIPSIWSGDRPRG